MSRGDNGFIRPGYDGLEVPDAPTVGTATAGDEEVSVTFTAPSDEGGSAITEYGAVALNSGETVATGTASSSPVTVSGLTNGTSYTFKVWAINAYGPSGYSGASGSVTPSVPEQGFFAAGYTDTSVNTIDKILIATTGNATDFGDLAESEYQGGAVSSSTRGVVGGGSTTNSNITYFEFASGGTVANFGNLNQGVGGAVAGASNSTRGLFMGGFYFSGSNIWANNIQYITIASTGNASDFGDLTQGRSQTDAVASSTRAVCASGSEGNLNRSNVIDYVTIATTGNAVSFGTLTEQKRRVAGAASATRGLFAGGRSQSVDNLNVIEYITIASTGNGTDFGDLTIGREELGGLSGSTRAVFGGGGASSGSVNVMDYVTIASTGNATDFGDLTLNRSQAHQACSNSHGGLS